MTARLIFDHVPKTAGVSAGTALAHAFGEEPRVLQLPHFKLPFDGPDELLAGHFWFYPGEPLHDEWLYATLLREPIARAISHFYFVRLVAETDDAPDDPQIGRFRGRDFDELLRRSDPSDLRHLANVQARHFAARVVDAPDSLDDDGLFAAAVEAISEYDIIGLTDDVTEFVDRCCVASGRPRPELVETLNARERELLSSDIGERVAEFNRADLRLWEWARARGPMDAPRRRPSGRRPGRPVDFGTREVEIEAVRATVDAEAPARTLTVEVDLASHIAVDDLTVGVEVGDGRHVVGTNTRLEGQVLSMAPGDRVTLSFEWDAVAAGSYDIAVAAHRGRDHSAGCFEWIDPAATVDIPDSLVARRPASEMGGLQFSRLRVVP
jgi:hypothetical protein